MRRWGSRTSRPTRRPARPRRRRRSGSLDCVQLAGPKALLPDKVSVRSPSSIDSPWPTVVRRLVARWGWRRPTVERRRTFRLVGVARCRARRVGGVWSGATMLMATPAGRRSRRAAGASGLSFDWKRAQRQSVVEKGGSGAVFDRDRYRLTESGLVEDDIAECPWIVDCHRPRADRLAILQNRHVAAVFEGMPFSGRPLRNRPAGRPTLYLVRDPASTLRDDELVVAKSQAAPTIPPKRIMMSARWKGKVASLEKRQRSA